MMLARPPRLGALSARRLLALVLAASALTACPRPEPIAAPKPNGNGAVTAAAGLFPESLEGAAAAARARRWQTAYEIYARYYLRDHQSFERNPELYYAFVEVCFQLSRHRAAVALAKRFVALRPADPRIAIVVRALTLYGKHRDAIQLADRYLSQGLGHRPTLIHWRARSYIALGRYARASSTLQKVSGPVGGANDYWLAESLRRQGRYAEARAAAERAARGSASPHVQALLSQLVRAERTGLDIRLHVPQAVELSIYHLLTDDGTGPYGALVTLQIGNLLAASTELRVEAELVGFSQAANKQVTVVGGAGRAPRPTAVYLTPLLDRGAVVAVGERQRRTLRVRVTRLADGAVIVDDSKTVSILPRDYVAYSRQSREDPEKLVRDDNGFGVLITPRGRWVDPVVAYAKTLHPRKEMPGPFADSISQVRALYDYLKSIGVSYTIGSPALYRQKGEPMVQRIRPPGTVLQLRAAQCWEGTNVFASVLEALKLEPVLLRVPGHILIGWKKNRYDRLPGAAGTPYYFLETTIIGKADFDTALRAGAARLVAEYRAGNLRNRMARLIEVGALRARGIIPQPWDD